MYVKIEINTDQNHVVKEYQEYGVMPDLHMTKEICEKLLIECLEGAYPVLAATPSSVGSVKEEAVIVKKRRGRPKKV